MPDKVNKKEGLQPQKFEVLRPVSEEFKISSPFGNRILRGVPDFHKGVDFAVPVGTEIRAICDGIVQRAGWESAANPKKGYGLRVWQTGRVDGVKVDIWYGHCSELLIGMGEIVRAGQVIAKSGNTGSSTGAHLHLGIRRLDSLQYVNPTFRPERIA